MAAGCITLLFLVGLHLVALLAFGSGFFLSRYEVADTSACHSPPLNFSGIVGNSSKTGEQGFCWQPRRFRRLVFVVIDALRYDFAAFEERDNAPGGVDEQMDSSPYRNKLPVLHEKLRTEPGRSLLYRFEADPPTVTQQRLKGLTTGGVPTFFELKSAFAESSSTSSIIAEDNLMAQAARAGRVQTFMGDDTWEALYPGLFNRSFPFPSFNVRDIHTVDDGVERHLGPELERDDWDILVVHTLGVDHVGHTFGPDNEHMRRKLDQMDGMLRRLMNSIEEQERLRGDSGDGNEGTLLAVLGDHGMSPDGNHGGDTEEEVGAALFLWSAKVAGTTHASGKPRQAMQPLHTLGSHAHALDTIYASSATPLPANHSRSRSSSSPRDGHSDGNRRGSQVESGNPRLAIRAGAINVRLAPWAWQGSEEVSAQWEREDATEVDTLEAPGGDIEDKRKDKLRGYAARERAAAAAEAEAARIAGGAPTVGLDRTINVAQVDLVPSLALLLGLPIPFSSVGQILPELFFYSPRDSNPTRGGQLTTLAAATDETVRWQQLNTALLLNFAQVQRYLSTYVLSVPDSLPRDEVRHVHGMKVTLQRLVKEAQQIGLMRQTQERSLEDLLDECRRARKLALRLRHALASARALSTRVWARFEVTLMAVAAMLLSTAVLCVICEMTCVWARTIVDGRHQLPGFPSTAVLTAGIVVGLGVHVLYGVRLHSALLALAVAQGSAVAFLVSKVIVLVRTCRRNKRTASAKEEKPQGHKRESGQSSTNMLSSSSQATGGTILAASLAIVMRGAGLFSNSFIESEPSAIVFVANSAALIVAAASARSRRLNTSRVDIGARQWVSAQCLLSFVCSSRALLGYVQLHATIASPPTINTVAPRLSGNHVNATESSRDVLGDVSPYTTMLWRACSLLSAVLLPCVLWRLGSAQLQWRQLDVRNPGVGGREGAVVCAKFGAFPYVHRVVRNAPSRIVPWLCLLLGLHWILEGIVEAAGGVSASTGTETKLQAFDTHARAANDKDLITGVLTDVTHFTVFVAQLVACGVAVALLTFALDPLCAAVVIAAPTPRQSKTLATTENGKQQRKFHDVARHNFALLAGTDGAAAQAVSAVDTRRRVKANAEAREREAEQERSDNILVELAVKRAQARFGSEMCGDETEDAKQLAWSSLPRKEKLHRVQMQVNTLQAERLAVQQREQMPAISPQQLSLRNAHHSLEPAMLTVLILFFLLFLLSLGRNAALPVTLTCIQIFAGLRLLGGFKSLHAPRNEAVELQRVGAGALLLCFTGTLLFYATGHSCSFSALQFDRAFVFGDQFEYFRCGATLALNTFGPHLVPLFLIPMLVCWHMSASAELSNAGSSGSNVSDPRKIMQVVPSLRALYMVVLAAMLYHSAVACFTLCNAMLQRRHLMVWRVFAPKFIFDSALLLCVDALLLLLWPWLRHNTWALKSFIEEIFAVQAQAHNDQEEDHHAVPD